MVNTASSPSGRQRVRQRREPRPDVTAPHDANYHIALAEEHYAGSRTKEAYESLQRAQAHPSYSVTVHELRTSILYILIVLALTRPFHETEALSLARNHCGLLIHNFLADGEPYSQLVHDTFYAMASIHYWRKETEDAEFCKLWVLQRCPEFTKHCGTRALLKHWKEFDEGIAVNEIARSSLGYEIRPQEDDLAKAEGEMQPVKVQNKDYRIWGTLGLAFAISSLTWVVIKYGLSLLVAGYGMMPAS
ncbi:hypothetical protein TWF694_005782 [Orbilia ellipsospora]|uniref:Uncharacterized protein n=1 Tax=Orbilia ellipsospora TaxID=2528407 RepID=A0AAV9WT19_9PEZI